MEVLSMLWFIFFFILQTLLFQLSNSETLVVDGISKWKYSTVQIGDTIIFEHKYEYNLYIFQNQNAFTICNFSEAALLTKSNSKSYTWHPSRPGFFYFSFKNGINNTVCLQGQKLAISVSSFSPRENHFSSAPEMSPEAAPPPLTSDSIVSSSPAYTRPLPPGETISPANSPMGPVQGDEIPFINSNPAIPLPNGEADSATLHHFPTSGQLQTQVSRGSYGNNLSTFSRVEVVNFLAIQSSLCSAIFLMLF